MANFNPKLSVVMSSHNGEKYLKEATQKWKYTEHAYARRQMTWFRKDRRIKWFDIQGKRWQDKVEKEVFIWYTQGNAKEN